MKRSIKAATLFLIVLCLCSLKKINHTDSPISDPTTISPQTLSAKTKKVYTYRSKNKQLDSFEKITADLGDIDFRIKPSKDNRFRMSYLLYCYNSTNPLTWEIKDNTLHLNGTLLDWAPYRYKKGTTTIVTNKTTITLFIPSKCLTEITLNAKDADLSLRNITCQDTSVYSRFGDISVSGIKSSSKLYLQSKDGDISLSDIHTGSSLQVESRYGDITASTITVSGTSKMDTKDGDIKLSDFHANDSLQIKTAYGNVNSKKLTLPGTACMDTADGDIKLSGTSITGKLQLNSTYGNFKLGLNKKSLNALDISIKTTEGDMSVPKSLGGKKKHYQEYGWSYEKKASSGSASLKAVTKEGDVTVKAGTNN